MKGAIFSKDGTQVLTWSDDATARVWDVSKAMQPRATLQSMRELCANHLRGTLASSRSGDMVPFVRLIDEDLVSAAPILRGREGEDVCAFEPLPWWDKPLQRLIEWAGVE